MASLLQSALRSADVEVGEKKRADVFIEEEHEEAVVVVEEEENKESSQAAKSSSSAATDVATPAAGAAASSTGSSTAAAATEAAAAKDAEASGSMDTKADDKSLPSTWSSDSVIMFDWDDTLLASSFLSARGYRVDCPETPAVISDASDAAQLRAQEQCVVSLLTLALTYGAVNIVTNAETGWVELSAQKFMPAVLPLLSKVTVLSARSTFEPAHPEAPLKWKYFAFHERLRAVFGESCMDARAAEADIASLPVGDMKKNIVSFGDSHVEREAIRAITRGVPGWRCKSVKFAERPTVEQLRRQLELVSNCFQYIATHTADLDLQLTVTLHAQQPASPTA